MRYIWAIGGIFAGIIMLLFLGIFLLGNNFFSAYTERADAKETMKKELEESRRAEKISSARGANADDFEVKALKEELDCQKYNKTIAFSELEKLLKTALPERVRLKRWYPGENDEDLDQIEAYAKDYAQKIKVFMKKNEDLREKIKSLDEDLKVLEAEEEKIHAKEEELEVQFKSLELRMKNAMEAHERGKVRYAETPVFQRAKVEKELRKCVLQINQGKKELKEIEKYTNDIELELSAVSLKIRDAKELREKYEEQELESALDTVHCREALAFTISCLKATREIKRLKAEILKLEESRENKKIELIY